MRDLPWWMQHDLLICGYEGEGGDSGQGGSGDAGAGAGTGSNDGTGDGNSNGGQSSDDDGDDDDDLPDDKDVEGLKSALKKERQSSRTNSKSVRTLERQLRDAQKKLDEQADKDKSETERANKQAQTAQEKVTKLAARLQRQALDQIIEREARALKFKDVDDALSLVDRSEIEVDQDDDDPADITIDAKSVKRAVKALAERKKHLIGDDDSPGGDSGPSGSRFNSGQKDKQQASADALKALYPALR